MSNISVVRREKLLVSVSVTMTVYNGEKYLEKCLSSILAQSFKDDEVIVVNDGSVDNTEKILAKYEDQIEILSQPNRGISKSLNRAIENSNGRYIAYIAHDDWWMPHKLAKEYELIRSHDVGVVYSDFVHVGNAGNEVRASLPNFDRNRLLKECYINISSSLIDKKYLDDIKERDNYYFDESLGSAMDWDVWIRLSRICEFKHLAEPLSYYRVHGMQTSQKAPGLYRSRHIKDRWEVYRRYNSFSLRNFVNYCLIPRLMLTRATLRKSCKDL